MDSDLIPQEAIHSKILFIRDKKVMLDRDLAILYKVETRALTQAVKRNIERFPEDFMFQLTKQEVRNLMSQFVTSSSDSNSSWGGTRKLPYAFTEQGVSMLSSVLKSKQAIQVNIQIMRTFTKMREMFLNYQEIKEKIEDMERKYDHQFKINSYLFEEIFQDIKTINKLLEPPTEPKRKMGFKIEKK